MSVDPRHIQIGMEIVGSDGELVGIVKEVRGAEFVADRPLARDVIVPVEAVQALVNATASTSVNPHIILVIRAESVSAQGWEHPD